ncbi:MAG TPA: DUF378 domain-containing protein [Clostridium sp.]|jgi:hypothetical protein|uniref:DUF378 domain-containing protein n=1 Tax=Clostridium lapidicellarium TaxID=3240931 RepID=A0ABV4DYV0_9CLOT|nr:DUF378 domain-containing protein [uncultured Clostridium sp.]NLU08602.1 DUF378 domain-containing protein [Clostridiales bacterium]HBC95814.1 DUF378 domain-containing protein [Clostridium sp.]
MRTLDIIALVLVVIGALNWGLIGFFRYDLIASLFGTMSPFTRVLYALVGLGGLYALSFFGKETENNRHTKEI